jgi:uronate dehydrogenase
MTKVALLGASGNIGQVLRPVLLKQGLALRSAGGTRALTPVAPEEEICHGDLRDPAFVDRLLAGVDALIHWQPAASSGRCRRLSKTTCDLHSIYQGAPCHRVRRIVFASSNHAVGMHSVVSKLDLDCDLWPDGFHGPTKVWGEAMARM